MAPFRRLRRGPPAARGGQGARVSLVGHDAPPLPGQPAPDGLLLFLTTGCLACREVWSALATGPQAALAGNPPITVVTPDPALEDPEAIGALTPASIPLVMSSAVWFAYRPGPAPWVAVVRHGRVRAEGSVSGWDGVTRLVGAGEVADR